MEIIAWFGVCQTPLCSAAVSVSKTQRQMNCWPCISVTIWFILNLFMYFSQKNVMRLRSWFLGALQPVPCVFTLKSKSPELRWQTARFCLGHLSPLTVQLRPCTSCTFQLVLFSLRVLKTYFFFFSTPLNTIKFKICLYNKLFFFSKQQHYSILFGSCAAEGISIDSSGSFQHLLWWVAKTSGKLFTCGSSW